MDASDYLGLPWDVVLYVAISTAVLYLVFAAILALFSQRLFSSPSSLNLAVAAVLGAVTARAMLGPLPTMAGGAVALSTLLIMELAAGPIRRRQFRTPSRQRALAVIVAGRLDEQVLERFQLDRSALWAVLRGNGVGHPDEVALLVLEGSGRFSLLRRGSHLSPEALTGLRDEERVRAELVAAGDLSAG